MTRVRRPSLATELLAYAGVPLESAVAECGSIDLTQIVPTEYRSDAITVLRDPEGNVIAAVIVEVQLGADEDKRWTWPLYSPRNARSRAGPASRSSSGIRGSRSARS